MIDAMKKLKPEHIKTMIDTIPNGNTVDILIGNDFSVSMPIENILKDFFMNEEIEKVVNDKNDNTEIDFVSGDFVLQIACIDYKWWIAPVRNKKYARLSKLFSTEIETKTDKSKSKAKNDTTIDVVIGIMDANNNVVDIKQMTDKRNAVIDFINAEYSKRLLKSRFTAKIVFSINGSSFKTMEELLDEGVFVKL